MTTNDIFCLSSKFSWRCLKSTNAFHRRINIAYFKCNLKPNNIPCLFLTYHRISKHTTICYISELITRLLVVECQTGFYGNDCSFECGFCSGGNSNCDFITGICLNACQDGYNGTFCSEGKFKIQRWSLKFGIFGCPRIACPQSYRFSPFWQVKRFITILWLHKNKLFCVYYILCSNWLSRLELFHFLDLNLF